MRASAKVVRGKRSKARFAPHPAFVKRRYPPLDRLRVGLEPVGAAREHGERGVGDELRREERLVHPVAREGIDEAGGVADHRGRAAREQAPGATFGKR